MEQNTYADEIKDTQSGSRDTAVTCRRTISRGHFPASDPRLLFWRSWQLVCPWDINFLLTALHVSKPWSTRRWNHMWKGLRPKPTLTSHHVPKWKSGLHKTRGCQECCCTSASARTSVTLGKQNKHSLRHPDTDLPTGALRQQSSNGHPRRVARGIDPTRILQRRE